MIISEQDQNTVLQDSVRQIPDTPLQKLTVPADSTTIVDSVPAVIAVIPPEKEKYEVMDTTAVCQKNPVHDLIFYNPENGAVRIYQDYSNSFPFLFIKINRKREAETIGTLTKHLKDGKLISSRPFHNDWIIIVILVSAFLYATISAFYGKLFQEVKRFLVFSGIGDPASRDTGALFHWKSTLFNIISFFNIALFAYCTADNYDFIPYGISGIVFWMISFVILTLAVTIRYIICSFTGKISREYEAFGEYTVTIYQSYRFLGFIHFLISILLSYTTLFPINSLFISGFIMVAFIYLMRILRLLLIFLKHNISILYLILYLCALEFLPVLILIKYFTDLF